MMMLRKVLGAVAVPIKKRKDGNIVKNRNQQLLMEIGEDIGESGEEFDEDLVYRSGRKHPRSKSANK